MPRNTHSARGRTPLIFVIDDDHTHAQLLARRLGSMGFKARSSQVIPQIVTPDDILIIDFGVLVALEPVNQELASHAHLIVTTGSRNRATQVTAAQLGCSHVVIKPIDFEALVQALDQAHKRPRSAI